MQQNANSDVTVWYGAMPESNGRVNWTASLHKKGGDIHLDGFCFARSEYPDRVRYEADRMRWIIGELTEKPDILAYDADKHSGHYDRLVNAPTVIDRALIYATEAHAKVGQARKYTGEPYIVHPIEVMMLVRSVGGTDEMQAAALLHDVIEDTSRTYSDIAAEFGAEIADMVLDLTDQEGGNRENRKALACLRLHQASAEVQTIKLADLISNTSSIVQHDPKFATTYLREKQEMLGVLTKGDPYLFAIAREQIDQAFKDLLECVA